MNKTTSKKFIKSLSIACLLIILSSIFTISIGDRVSAKPKTLPSYTLNFTPPNKGQSAGNGTKKPRISAARSLGILQAIVPWTETDPIFENPIHRGQTISSHPVFWLSYDGQSNRNTPIEIYLEIKDTSTNGQTYFYQNDFSVIRNSESNTLSIQLPKEASPLLPEIEYQWKFVTSKNGKIVGETVGYIERVKLSSETTSQLCQANTIMRAEIYAQQSIWHELLDTLAELRQENPEDTRFKNAWDNLLQEYLVVP